MKYDQYIALVEDINGLFNQVAILQNPLILLNEEQFKATAEPTFVLLFKNSSYASAVAKLLDIYESPYLIVSAGRGISCDLAGELTSLATILNTENMVDILIAAIKKVSLERLKIIFDALLMKNFPLVVANKSLITHHMKSSQVILSELEISKIINLVKKWDEFYSACAENNTSIVYRMLSINSIPVPCVAVAATPAIKSAAVSTKVKGSALDLDQENTRPLINRHNSL